MPERAEDIGCRDEVDASDCIQTGIYVRKGPTLADNMKVEGMTIIKTETRAVRSPVSGLTGGFSWFSLLLWGLDIVTQERHGSIQLPSDANKGVVSSNTGGSDETPTLVSTGVPHRQRSQGGAVWTIIADRQNGSGVGYLRKR